MKRSFTTILVLLALCASAGLARAAGTHGFDQAKKDGFQVVGLITADPNWESKWRTSPKTTPEFHGIDVLPPNTPVYILTFFSGAKTVAGRAKLICDITIVESTGKKTHLPAKTCLDAPVAHPEYINLTGLDFRYQADAGDPSGTLSISITITDANRRLSLPLHLAVKVDTSGSHA
jgi:hypothetical protein